MAQCSFSIQFHISPDEVAAKARDAITAAGGNFQGIGAAGAFDVPTPLGSVRGQYAIEGAVIHVAITSKPFLVSCGMIEKQLRRYFAVIA